MEEWRAIVDFPNYEVSSFGGVRRVGGKQKSYIGRHCTKKDSHGYEMVQLSGPTRRAWCFVHRLVIEAFVERRPSERHFVAHNNGVRNDNRPENLRWATPKENTADTIKHGTMPRGERSGASKLTESVVRQVRAMRGQGVASRKVAHHFGICQRTVLQIANRRTWAHVDA